eukprot:TRINITY_DN23038_c0_g1_i1.p3 TRINITY_DN23038_c0_g1~~TRINITY_DN23038_c0_g1_i1.p3  ORF type:complete len:159 (+),score=29.83 TRINITY_DN23038_c0_g1_i1:161-637(+)
MSVKVRDLDYVNPRQKLPSCALPPEVRARLGLAPSTSEAKLHEGTGLGSTLGGTSSEQLRRPLRRALSLTSLNLPAGHDRNCERLATGGQSDAVYVGASNVAQSAANGAAGAGSDWENPRGHAFVRRGTAQRRLQSLQERGKEQRLALTLSVSKRRGL